MEATLKTITLPEDFTDFDSQLPDLNTIDVVDHFSLNQCRTEDITLKENFENHFLTMERIGEEIQSYQGLFDQSFSVHGYCFGDEKMAVDLIDFIADMTDDAVVPDIFDETSNELPATPPPTAVSAAELESVKPELSCLKGRSSPAPTETTFLVNAEEGFALALVVASHSSNIQQGRKVSRGRGGAGDQLFPCGTSPNRPGLEGGVRQQTDPEEMREQSREGNESHCIRQKQS
ncbi:hypothetical protein cypCar_00035594 [Cyprinus carpio]|nr:hypothetical protein cypCar_00035594 [Cyprinus carpio]